MLPGSYRGADERVCCRFLLQFKGSSRFITNIRSRIIKIVALRSVSKLIPFAKSASEHAPRSKHTARAIYINSANIANPS